DGGDAGFERGARVGGVALQAIDPELERRERRPELVRRDPDERIANGDRALKLLEEAPPFFFGSRELFGARAALGRLAYFALDRGAEANEAALREEIVRACLHHLDGDLLAHRSRHDDERDVEPALAQDRERRGAAEAGKAEIGE